MRWYVEHDGRVLVVREGERWRLPGPEEVDVPVTEHARRRLRGTEVAFGQAELAEHPESWPSKDELADDPEAEPLLHAAINASLFRPVVGVVVGSGPEILLVKPSRGVARGHWTLPGGFVNAFETPEEAARRELREEVGLEIDELTLETTVTYGHHGAPYPILGIGFTARAASRELTLSPDEIAEARWADPGKAAEDAGGIARALLETVTEGSR